MESTTYAIIRTGGKQYRVAQGQTLRVEKIAKDAGAEVSFDVLFVKDGDRVQSGTPVVAGASVTGEVVRQFRDRKLLVFKKRSKKGLAPPMTTQSHPKSRPPSAATTEMSQI